MENVDIKSGTYSEKKMWTKIKDRKWELKHNGIVLATIYHRPTDNMWSLYVSSPVIYSTHQVIGKTYQYSTMRDAQQAFLDLCKEKAVPWCSAMVEYFSSEKKDHFESQDH